MYRDTYKSSLEGLSRIRANHDPVLPAMRQPEAVLRRPGSRHTLRPVSHNAHSLCFRTMSISLPHHKLKENAFEYAVVESCKYFLQYNKESSTRNTTDLSTCTCNLSDLLWVHLLAILVVPNSWWRSSVSSSFSRSYSAHHISTLFSSEFTPLPTSRSFREWRKIRSTEASSTFLVRHNRQRQMHQKYHLSNRINYISRSSLSRNIRIAADSTIFRIVNLLIALSFGVHREQLLHLTGLT